MMLNFQLEIIIKIDDNMSKNFEGYRSCAGDSFDVSVPIGKQELQFPRNYVSLRKPTFLLGEWMIWVAANGYVRLGKNTASWVENVASSIGVASGMPVYLKAPPPPPRRKLVILKNPQD